MNDPVEQRRRRQQLADWGHDAVQILERQDLDCTCDYVEEQVLCEVEPRKYVTCYDHDCPTHWPVAM